MPQPEDDAGSTRGDPAGHPVAKEDTPGAETHPGHLDEDVHADGDGADGDGDGDGDGDDAGGGDVDRDGADGDGGGNGSDGGGNGSGDGGGDGGDGGGGDGGGGNGEGDGDPAGQGAVESSAAVDDMVADEDAEVGSRDIGPGPVVTEDPISNHDVVAPDPVVADQAAAEDEIAGPGGVARAPAGTLTLDRQGERDRDQVDFSAVASFLRRRGIIGPAPGMAPASVLHRPDATVDPSPAAEAPRPQLSRPSILGIALPERDVLRHYFPPVLMVAVIGWIALIHHLPGVDWGDDFALYMRQAKGLAMGNIGEVVGANRFAVENSGWSTFSPYSYPWGWPLLIAPVYAVFGFDYEPVKLLEVAAFCIFLLCFFGIVRRRAGVLGATVLTLLVGFSPSFIGATDTVLSDIPFLCFVGVSLWWLDHCRERGILVESRRRLVILGLLLAYTFNIRREGISLVVALLAVHLSVLAAKRLRAGTLRDVDWKAVVLPYLTFAGASAAFHLILPTVLRPTSTGIGLSNIPHRFKWHQDILAEHVGLKDFGYPTQLLSSERAGKNALTLLMVLAVVGLLARLLARHHEDIALAAYLCTATFVVLVSPYQEGRYLFTITPLLLYFAYQALPAVVELLSPVRPSPSTAPRNRRLLRLAVIPPALVLAGLVLINANDVRTTIDYRRLYQPVVNGPEAPDATQMFAAVKSLTRGDDVILFFRARAMTLYTDRLAVQGSNLDELLPRSDWYVMAKGSTYSQTPLTDDEGAARGLTKAWENELWVIWRIPPPTA